MEDFSFFIVSYYNAYGPYSFQREVYFRAAAPPYSFSATAATSRFHNFQIRSIQLLKLVIFWNIIFVQLFKHWHVFLLLFILLL